MGKLLHGVEIDPTRPHVEIDLGVIGFAVNSDGDIALTGAPQVDLAPVMIGSTGVVIEARDLGLFLDTTIFAAPVSLPDGVASISVQPLFICQVSRKY